MFRLRPTSRQSRCKNTKNNIEDNSDALDFIFRLLTLTGLWLPLHWQSKKHLKIAYQIYSTITVLATYIFVGFQLMLLVNEKLDMNFFTDLMFTLPTAVSVCFKMMNLIVRRNEVCQLREMLYKRKWCFPRDDEEREMQRKTNEFLKKFTIRSNIACQLTLLFLIIVPILQDSSSRKLTFPIWLPYDLNNPRNFWIIYSLEIYPMIAGILLNVTTDLIVCGFFQQAFNQIDFLKYRLSQLPYVVEFEKKKGQSTEKLEQTLINEIAMHHEFIIKFAKKVTKTFNVIIIEQYIASVLLFSALLYQIIFGTFLQKIMAFGYIICMTGEFFTYCWFGNEITMKSSELGDTISQMDWTVLSKKSIGKLRFIKLRTCKPIVISYGGVIVLNIDSFKTIMKVTYSAFNVLKETTIY